VESDSNYLSQYLRVLGCMKRLALLDDSVYTLNLGNRITHALERARIKTVGQLIKAQKLHKLGEIYGLGDNAVERIAKVLDEFHVPSVNISSEVTFETRASAEVDLQSSVSVEAFPAQALLKSFQLELIGRDIFRKRLHPHAIIAKRTIQEWMDTTSENKSMHDEVVLQVYSNILLNKYDICEEILDLFGNTSSKDLIIVTRRFGSQQLTLEQIGIETGLTRERVRQICNKVESKIESKFRSRSNYLRIQSAILYAIQMGDEFNFEGWLSSITNSGLLGFFPSESMLSSHVPSELLIATVQMISSVDNSINLPHHWEKLIHLRSTGKSDVTARHESLRQNLGKSQKRLIARHEGHSGAINSTWLASELQFATDTVQELLIALDYSPLVKSWYILQREYSTQSKNHVFFNSLDKLFFFCGPLPVNQIRQALLHVLHRSGFPCPPVDVLEEILRLNKYQYEDEMYFDDVIEEPSLSRAESVIWQCIKSQGPVVHHAELAEAFVNSDLSFPSLHAALKRSPLFETVGKALYKLRGTKVQVSDVERARAADEWTPLNVEVKFNRVSYSIEVTLSISIYALATGTIISKQFPDMTGAWTCLAGDKTFPPLVATASEFKKLRQPLEYLSCRVGDRVLIKFNTRQRHVEISKFD
jgi:hypothetical protein